MATSITTAPLEYLSKGAAFQFAVPPSSFLGTMIKFGRNTDGQTIFEYVDPDKVWTQNSYQKKANGSYQLDEKGNLIPIYNSDGTPKVEVQTLADGTPITNKTWMDKVEHFSISPDGRSLKSNLGPNQRSVSGYTSDSNWTISGSGNNEQVTGKFSNDWSSGVYASPLYGVADVASTPGVTNLKDAYQKYLGAFSSLAKGASQRITSKTVTDEGILGDIKQAFVDLGPLAMVATAVLAPEFLPLASGINTLAKGGSVEDALKAAGTSYILQQGTSALAPEVDLNAATSDFQNVYGGNLPIEDVAAAFEPVVPEAVTVGAPIPTPDIVPTPLPAIEPSVVQPDYFSADAGPLADTTIDDAFVQDMSQGIEPVVPPENPYLAGMEETTATEGAGVAGAENPTGTYTGGANYLSGMEETAATEGAGVAGAENPTGATTVLPTEAPSLTPQQAYQLLKLGAGLFGGAGALTMAARGLTGGAGALGGLMGPSMPTIQAPTPFTGTYSGMNPYDAAYFQQVQQNYNRLFPTMSTNVAGPLESWYQTKYVPDTNISNKLFGV